MLPTMNARGKMLRDEALAALEKHREFTLLRLQRAFVSAIMAAPNGLATIEDARRVVKIPAGVSPTLCGAATRALARAGLITAAGYVEAERPEAHARPIRRWRLSDRAAALAWLADNPDPQAPPERIGHQFLLPLDCGEG